MLSLSFPANDFFYGSTSLSLPDHMVEISLADVQATILFFTI
jgi:hypothetical protein